MSKAKKRNGKARSARHKRLSGTTIPGELVVKSELVTIEMDQFAAAIFDPDALEEAERSKRDMGETRVQSHYVTQTRFVNEKYVYEYEHRGRTVRVPHEVVAQWDVDTKLIKEEQRRLRGVELAAHVQAQRAQEVEG